MPDTELAKALQMAKKKPHNFAILAKGANVMKVLVSKKPIKEGEVQKAKKEFQAGTICRGVCRGDGGDLVFEVTDKQPSIGEPKLKAFIKDEAGLTIKTRFETVAATAEIDDEGVEEEVSEGATSPVREATAPSPSPSSATSPPAPTPKKSQEAPPPAPTQEKSQEASPPPSPPAPTPEESLGQQLRKAVNKLTPLIKTAITAQPGRKTEVLRAVQDIEVLLKAGDFQAAKPKVLELNTLVKDVASLPPAPPAPARPDELRIVPQGGWRV